ncbi:MAG: M23 family metallopeptidase [Bacteroidales bacterium]|nr:M23 family metallopeptidase [Bacteroidales bacterium]MCL2133486.1 M23 family metallopeptidase [Bacteroidales bacterium]
MFIGKRTLIASFYLLMPLIAAAQGPRAVTLKVEYEKSKSGLEYKYHAISHDYCPYYIVVDLSRITNYEIPGTKHVATLHPGQNYLFRLKNRVSISSTSGIRYSYYLGNINAKVDAEYRYALPIAPGDSVRIKHNRGKLIFNLKHTSDTVYACRDGIVCSDEFIAKNLKGTQITIYHKDGSFAQYSALQKILTQPGKPVKTGMPIAIVGTNEKGTGMLEIQFYFLDENKIKDTESKSKHSILRPFFHTQNYGYIRLDDNTTYIGEITDEVLMQDMSKKEQEQYLKRKKK